MNTIWSDCHQRGSGPSTKDFTAHDAARKDDWMSSIRPNMSSNVPIRISVTPWRTVSTKQRRNASLMFHHGRDNGKWEALEGTIGLTV